MIKHIWAVYFSPSGKTEQVTMAVAEGAAGVMNIDKIHRYDFTLPDKREDTLCFGEKDLVILGCPTYAGQNLRTWRFSCDCNDLWRQEY